MPAGRVRSAARAAEGREVAAGSVRDAVEQYALAAFDADAVGYLLKPMTREKLGEAVVRAEKILASDRQRS